MRLVIVMGGRTIAEIDGFEGTVPRRDEWVYVPVDGEAGDFGPMLVKDVYHSLLAPNAGSARPGGRRRYGAARVQTVTVLV